MITNSKEETQKFAANFAKEILEKAEKNKPLTFPFNGKVRGKNNAIIIGLYGNLGAGKTTFTQGFAKGLGIKKKIISPTFVILKKFKITNKTQITNHKQIQNLKHKIQTKHKTENTNFKNLIHIDAYRLESPEELLNLSWLELIKNTKNIILVEWADKIKKILPKNHIKINFKVLDKEKREILINQILNIKM